VARRRLFGWHVVLALGYAAGMFIGLQNAVVAERSWLWGSAAGFALLGIGLIVAAMRLLWWAAASLCRCRRRPTEQAAEAM